MKNKAMLLPASSIKPVRLKCVSEGRLDKRGLVSATGCKLAADICLLSHSECPPREAGATEQQSAPGFVALL